MQDIIKIVDESSFYFVIFVIRPIVEKKEISSKLPQKHFGGLLFGKEINPTLLIDASVFFQHCVFLIPKYEYEL